MLFCLSINLFYLNFYFGAFDTVAAVTFSEQFKNKPAYQKSTILLCFSNTTFMKFKGSLDLLKSCMVEFKPNVPVWHLRVFIVKYF